jgi:hypothetical protein
LSGKTHTRQLGYCLASTSTLFLVSVKLESSFFSVCLSCK